MRKIIAYILSKYIGAPLGSPISVGADPRNVLVSPDGLTCAVYNNTSTNVSLVDTPTNTVRATVTVGAGILSRMMAFTPDGSLLFVPNATDNTLTRIVVATGASSTISVGTSPQGLGFSPDGSILYVSNKTSNDLTRVVIATSATSSIPCGLSFANTGIVVTPDNSLIFAGGFSSNLVARIVVATNAVSTIDFGNHEQGLALTPSGDTLWVGTTTSIRSYTIATSTLNAAIPVVNGATNVVITKNNRFLLGFDFTGSNVHQLDLDTSIVTTVPVSTGPTWVALSSDGTLAYSVGSGANKVTRIVLGPASTSDIAVGTLPYRCCFSPNDLRLYVSNRSDNTLTVVDTLAAAA